MVISSSLGLSLSSSWEYPEVSLQQQDLLFLASIKAPFYENEERASRAPIDIICVIDKSGSMAGEKIDLVRKSLIFMIDQLKSSDRISVIGFDSNVSIDLPLTNLTDANKTLAKQKIELIKPGSQTNLSGGLFEAFSTIKNRPQPQNSVCSVLLFTDGIANKGVLKTQVLVSGVEKCVQDVGGNCTVFTFGFGADHDTNMLKAISDAGNGIYYFIAKEDEIPESFANCLGGLLSVVAQNIKLRVESANGVVLNKLLSNVKHTVISPTCIEVQVGDLYSEESRDLMFQCNVPVAKTPVDEFCPVELTLDYFDVIDTELKSTKVPSFIKRVAQRSVFVIANDQLDLQRNRIMAAQALADAKQIGDMGNLPQARQKLEQVIQQIDESRTANHVWSRGIQGDLNEALSQMQSKESYMNMGNKILNTHCDAHTKQRAVKRDLYSNRAKEEMKKKSESFFKK